MCLSVRVIIFEPLELKTSFQQSAYVRRYCLESSMFVNFSVSVLALTFERCDVESAVLACTWVITLAKLV